MRKSTINLIVGILIGLFISAISDSVSDPISQVGNTPHGVMPPASTIVFSSDTKDKNIFEKQIAPGLQIVEVPPPLNLMGNHPYQCYMNGEPINIPKELVKQLVAKHGNPTKNDPNFNVHNFTGNLKMIDAPAAVNTKQTTPFSFPSN